MTNRDGDSEFVEGKALLRRFFLPSLDPATGIPLICDLCDGNPKCIDWCPMKALSLTSSVGKLNLRWSHALAEAEKTVEKWNLPKETLNYAREQASSARLGLVHLLDLLVPQLPS